MKILSIVLALAGGATGLIAAWRWYRSSRVSIDPGWGLPGSGIAIEPVDPELKALDLQVATDLAFNQAGLPNASATFTISPDWLLHGSLLDHQRGSIPKSLMLNYLAVLETPAESHFQIYGFDRSSLALRVI